jgi:ABC-2 type transport system permease protein
MLQGASFAGIGVGFSTSLDISNGFFDRLMMSPVSRIAILVGSIFGGLLRALFVSTVVLAVGLIFGARPTGGLMGFFWLYIAVVGMCVASSCWALGLVYRFKDQRIAPLFPIGIFVVLFTSTAQVPLNVSTGWLQKIAQVNPVTEVLGLARQSFMDIGVTSAETIDGVIALLLIVFSLGVFAWTGLRRYLG